MHGDRVRAQSAGSTPLTRNSPSPDHRLRAQRAVTTAPRPTWTERRASGYGADMLTVRPLLALAAASLTAAALVAAPVAAAAGPARAVARSYAQRSYVVDGALGRRHFALTGPKATARGSDGS